MHVTVKPSLPRPLVTCDCNAYSFSAAEAHNADSNVDISCLHCRLVHEVMQACPFPDLELTAELLPPYISGETITAKMGEAHKEITILKGKPGTRKFSILSQDSSCEIVSEFQKLL